MHVIKLNATDSTNSYLRALNSKNTLLDYTVVQTNFQTEGRGQRGTNWASQSGKNLIFSVFKDVSFLDFQNRFFISMVTSLALVKALGEFSIPKLRIKWPNDILSEDKKICGTLIENIVKKHGIKATIVGVGLNVNQLEFDKLPNASSLKAITGVTYNIDELLNAVMRHIKYYFELLESHELQELQTTYESLLFRKDKPSTFRDKDGQLFTGYIKGITLEGNLCVLLEDEIIAKYELKEISLLY